MWFPLVAFGLLIHVHFWGAGLALLAMPGPWRRFWPVLVAPAGLALQSLVVWLGAHANFPGTNSYGFWSELIPLALLAVGLSRHGVKAAATDVSRFGLVFGAMAGALALLTLPLIFAAKGLTTVSLGSCDAGDYAAGARVLQEFARTDRTGFLGLTEVVQVMSADNFFDFWLRLNHFTPSALIALNGTILGCAPYELTSVMTAVLLASSLPVVFWVSRAVMRYSGGVSLAIAALYGLSPVTWYAFAHVAMGQLLAAQGIALLAWAGVALWEIRLTARHAWAFFGVLAAAYALLLGGYNFILVVCLVPALAYAGGLALWQGRLGRFAGWLAAMVLPLVGCALVFPARVAGLAERFQLFRIYDFGWRIPALTPEGWLGMVNGPELAPWTFGGLRWVLTAVVLAGLALAYGRAIRQRRRAAWTAVCLCVPVLIGYAWLQLRGARLGTNASYDAYKLFAVFYPLLLPAFCWWITIRRSRKLAEWFVVVGFAGVVLAFNVGSTAMFVWRLARPPLIVDRELQQLRKIETMADVASVNVLLPDMWSRLWANTFLLRKPQYFLTHTYEGRLNTPLRGEWDLQGGLIALRREGGTKDLTARYSLVRAVHPGLRVDFGSGWHDGEATPDGLAHWRWAKRTATLRCENPHGRPLRIALVFDWRAMAAAPVTGGFREGGGPKLTIPVGVNRAKTAPVTIELPPGNSEFVLEFAAPAATVAGDARELGICVFKIDVLEQSGGEPR